MKVVLIIIGVLAGIYALLGVVQFVGRVLSNDPSTAYGIADIAASAVPVCLGLVVCLICFTTAFRKPETYGRNSPPNHEGCVHALEKITARLASH
jgi:uncharacterized membrane protein